jgi:pimeloyl-ACP methyl ester carboxylesterase
MEPLMIVRDGVRVLGEIDGDGTPVLGLHGLTATRRYVTMGSAELARAGHRVITYDARGHGESSPAPAPGAYDYAELVADARAVLNAAGVERAVLAGISMGAHTALALALADPERVAGLVVVTPGHDPATFADTARLARWDALANGLRERGVEGFIAAYGEPQVPERMRAAVTTAVRQRLGRHRDMGALADALQAVPRSAPCATLEELGRVAVPCVVVASRDELDAEHPYALAADYAEAIPEAELVSEPVGRAPLAWQGAALSRTIAALVTRATQGA